MDIQALMNRYFDWLKKETTFAKMGEYYEITTPFLDSQNDCIQIYFRQDGEGYLFSDDGYFVQKMLSGGLKLTPSRKKQIRTSLLQYGASLADDLQIIKRAPLDAFPQAKHLFVQALLKVDDMVSTFHSYELSNFTQHIARFLEENDIRFSADIQLVGRSGYAHNYDFILPKYHSTPERMCCAVNNPSRSQMSNLLFAWEDTKLRRAKDSQLIVFLNDANGLSDSVQHGFVQYGAKPVAWSQREKHLDLLKDAG